jgi:hypothetical protein
MLLEDAHELHADAAVGVVVAHARRHEAVAVAREIEERAPERACVHHIQRQPLLRKEGLDEVADGLDGAMRAKQVLLPLAFASIPPLVSPPCSYR